MTALESKYPQQVNFYLTDWIPSNSRLCAARIEMHVNLGCRLRIKCRLLLMSVYAPTDRIIDA